MAIIGVGRRRLSDPVVAFRDNSRWVQGFEPLKLDQSPPRPFRLRENGVYLITGGLGAIGLVIAKYLVETVRAKLVLIGRSGLPAGTDREKWLNNHQPSDKISDQIRKIKELEELGGEIITAGADIAEHRAG